MSNAVFPHPFLAGLKLPDNQCQFGTVIASLRAGKLSEVFESIEFFRWLGQIEHGKGGTTNPVGSRATPTIDGERLYILSGDGVAGCYDIKEKKDVWKKSVAEFGGAPAGGGCAESVLIYKDLAVITAGGKNCIVALDKKTGPKV